MRKLAILCVVVGLLSTAVVAGAGTGRHTGGKIDAAKPPVRFAVISINVPGVPLLPDYEAGARAAAAQLNASGGFGGRQVIIDSCNSSSQAAAATACAHTTLENHPIAEFGCDTVWGNAGLPIYADAKTPSFNCMNTSADFNNPWNFGINPAGLGESRASARFACSRANVKSWLGLWPDLPAFHSDQNLAAQIVQGCGKQVLTPIFYPLTAVDVTPYVNKVVQANPDLVTFFGVGAGPVLFFKGFQQNNFPASRIIAPSSIFIAGTTIAQAGSAVNGAYSLNELQSWSNTKNPDVVRYLAAFKGSSTDPRNATVQNGYMFVNWFYNVAKAVGFDKFNSATLAAFMNAKKNNRVHIPLSRTLLVPGPKKFPQQHQPYVLITQVQNAKLNVVPTGAKKDGWVYGY
jgi:ABC-type branched-subunit amino acid transport system substrate-binding protein